MHIAEKGRSRRKFLKVIVGSSVFAFVASIFYPIVRYLIPPKIAEPVPNNVMADKIYNLPTNSGKIFRFGRKPAILINTPQGKIRAFTAVCTHLDCTVQYRKDISHIWCACHNGHYDLNGRNIKGPPPKPLEEYSVRIVDDNIYVSKET